MNTIRLFFSTKYLSLVLVLCLFFPLASKAETVLSQSFSEPFFYFDLGGRKEYVFSNRAIYSVTNPAVSQVWSYSGTTIPDFSYDYDFNSFSGITYNQYSYVNVETAEYDGEELLWRNQEIWRFGKDGDGLFVESVLAIPETDSFSRFNTLFTYKKALFALRENGDLWKTTNGTTWNKVHTIDFPEDTNNFKVATTADRIFVGGLSESASTATVYRSKRGTTWREMPGNYQVALDSGASTSLGIRDIAVVGDNLYVAVKSNDSAESLWYKSFDTGEWHRPITTDREIHALDPLDTRINIFFYGDDSKYVNKCNLVITSCSQVFLSDEFINDDVYIRDFLTHVGNRSIYLFRDADNFSSFYLGKL